MGVMNGLKGKLLFPCHLRFHPTVPMDFLLTVPVHHIATDTTGTHLPVPHLTQQHPHLGRTEHYLLLQVDHTQHISHTVHFIQFAWLGNAKVLPNLVFLQIGCLKTAHMLGKRTDFFLIEPIGETALPEVHHLTVQPGIVKRMVVRTEDVLHLERQPAAVTRNVRQEVQVIARTTERSQMRAHLLIAGIGGTLHHLRKRYGCLNLVHLLVRHAHDFLQTDQSGFGQQQTVVLAHAAAVVLCHIIVAQLGRQKEMKPGGLVDALLTDQHQYLVVHAVAQKSGNHSHQPLLQAPVEHVACFHGVIYQ